MTDKQQAAERMADAFGEVAELFKQPRPRSRILDWWPPVVLGLIWGTTLAVWLASP